MTDRPSPATAADAVEPRPARVSLFRLGDGTVGMIVGSRLLLGEEALAGDASPSWSPPDAESELWIDAAAAAPGFPDELYLFRGRSFARIRVDPSATPGEGTLFRGTPPTFSPLSALACRDLLTELEESAKELFTGVHERELAYLPDIRMAGYDPSRPRALRQWEEHIEAGEAVYRAVVERFPREQAERIARAEYEVRDKARTEALIEAHERLYQHARIALGALAYRRLETSAATLHAPFIPGWHRRSYETSLTREHRLRDLTMRGYDADRPPDLQAWVRHVEAREAVYREVVSNFAREQAEREGHYEAEQSKPETKRDARELRRRESEIDANALLDRHARAGLEVVRAFGTDAFYADQVARQGRRAEAHWVQLPQATRDRFRAAYEESVRDREAPPSGLRERLEVALGVRGRRAEILERLEASADRHLERALAFASCYPYRLSARGEAVPVLPPTGFDAAVTPEAAVTTGEGVTRLFAGFLCLDLVTPPLAEPPRIERVGPIAEADDRIPAYFHEGIDAAVRVPVDGDGAHGVLLIKGGRGVLLDGDRSKKAVLVADPFWRG